MTITENLISLLGQKFPQARKDGLKHLAHLLALQVTQETEIQALVEKISEEKVTEFIKEWRKEVDGEVTKSTKSFEENLRAKYDLNPKQPNQLNPKTESNDVATLIAQAVKSAVEPLQTELASLKISKEIQTRKQTLETALKDIPQGLKQFALNQFERMKFDTDEDFTAFVTQTQNELKKAQQEAVSSAVGGFPRPVNSSFQSSQEKIKGEIEQWAKENVST